MDRKRSQLRHFISSHWFAVVLFLTFFLRLPSLFEPFTYGDEGVYLTLGQAVRKGLVLYRDIHDNKPPLLYIIAAIAGNFSYFRLILFGWTIATILFFRKLAETLFPKSKGGIIFSTFVFAVLSSVHTFESNVANAENFMILLTIIGFITYLKAKTRIQYFLSGTFFSLAVLFKVPAVFDFAAALIFVIIIVKNKKDIYSRRFIISLIYLLVGFLLPILFTMLFFATKGALSQYLKAAFFQNLPYLSSWASNRPKVFSLPLALIARASIVFLVSYILFVYRNRLAKELKLIIVWFIFALFGSLLPSRPYPHYLLQIIPALSLSFGLFFSKKRFVPVVLACVLIVVFIGFKFWHYENISYYKNFYQFAMGQKTKEQYFDYFGENANALYRAAIHIKARTKPNEKIFIWGNQPSLYSLSERLPVGRYTVAYHIVDFNGWRETMQALEKNPPRFIVITGDETRNFPDLFALISRNYATEFQIKNLRVLRRTVKVP